MRNASFVLLKASHFGIKNKFKNNAVSRHLQGHHLLGTTKVLILDPPSDPARSKIRRHWPVLSESASMVPKLDFKWRTKSCSRNIKPHRSLVFIILAYLFAERKNLQKQSCPNP